MTTVHFVAAGCNPARGGMELAAARIAGFAACAPGWSAIAYTTQKEPLWTPPEGANLRVVPLGERIAEICEPITGTVREQNETPRVEYLVLRSAVEACLAESSSTSHLVVSFFVSTQGFAAQHVADDFGLPHVAVVCGTDFSRDFHHSWRGFAVEFVARRAARMLTTNRDQETALVQAFPWLAGRTRTIHTSLAGGPPSKIWKPRRGDTVHLVCDSEYFFKKGAHLLVRAVARLVDEGLPVKLKIVGRRDADGDEYWNGLQARIPVHHKQHFDLRGRIEPAEIENFLLSGDIYCSATLGEGCSHAQMLALALGMPIVTTRTGTMFEAASGCPHVLLAPPGDVDALADNLREMVRRSLDGTIVIDERRRLEWVRQFGAERERTEWMEVLRNVAGK